MASVISAVRLHATQAGRSVVNCSQVKNKVKLGEVREFVCDELKDFVIERTKKHAHTRKTAKAFEE